MVTEDPKKLREQLDSSHKWAEGNNTILPHYLREDKIDSKIRKNATNTPPTKPTKRHSQRKGLKLLMLTKILLKISPRVIYS